MAHSMLSRDEVHTFYSENGLFMSQVVRNFLDSPIPGVVIDVAPNCLMEYNILMSNFIVTITE